MNLKVVERTEYANLDGFVSDWDVTEEELEPYLKEDVDDVDFDKSIIEQVDEPDKEVIDRILDDRDGLFHTRFDSSNGGSIIIKQFELQRSGGDHQRISLKEDETSVEIKVEGCVAKQLFVDFYKDAPRLLYYPKGEVKSETRELEVLD